MDSLEFSPVKTSLIHLSTPLTEIRSTSGKFSEFIHERYIVDLNCVSLRAIVAFVHFLLLQLDVIPHVLRTWQRRFALFIHIYTARFASTTDIYIYIYIYIGYRLHGSVNPLC